MTPEELVACIDFRHITDALTPGRRASSSRSAPPARAARREEMERDGFPAYTTSVGWLGYPDDKVRGLAREAVAEGWGDEDEGRRPARGRRARAAIIREEIGPERC